MSDRINKYVLASLLVVGFSGLAFSGLSFAQSGTSTAPSPFVPGDLKRPMFDTITPSYGTAAKPADSAKTVVAEIEGRSVTLGDVFEAMRKLPASVAALAFPDVYPGVLSQLVRQQALVIRAQHRALDEDPLVRRKMTAASDQVLANEFLVQEISGSITEAALLDRYNKEIAGKPGPEEVHLRVIMVRTEQLAKQIIGELRAGADFAALAKRSSIDPTAMSGGDAGFATLDQFTSEVGAVAFAIEPGQITPFPVRAPEAWFVLKVEERRRQPTRSFFLAREQLRQEILHESAGPLIDATVASMTVREYDVTGKDGAGLPNSDTANRTQ